MSLHGYPHGDWHCYSHGCRRDECRTAWRVYNERRRKNQAYERAPINRRVRAGHARTHLLHLRAQGMSIKTIADTAGVSFPVIEYILSGAKVGIYSTTEAKILAVHGPNLAAMNPNAFVDATGTHRRLQALNVNGWSTNDLGHELGCTGTNVAAIMRDPERVTATTALAVRDLYDRLWDAPPPARTGKALGARVRMTRAARARGWAPPMAWDDETIDDPTATPNIGDHSDATRRTVHIEDLEFLLEQDPRATAAQLADRLNVTRSAIQNACRRAGRDDLTNQLARNDVHTRGLDHPARKDNAA